MLTKNNIRTLCLATTLLFVLPGCRQSAEKEIGTGHLDGRTYTHDYFDLKITIPSKWTILTRDQMEDVVKRGRRISGNFSGSNRRGVMMISVSRMPMHKATRGKFNYNLMIGAERVGKFSGVETGAEYLEKVGALLTKRMRRKIKIELGPIERNRQVGHYDMDCRGITMKVGKHKIRQQHYAVKVGDYFLFIVATYQTGSQWRQLKQLLAAIH